MTCVATFYKFARVAKPASLKRELFECASGLHLKGTVLIANEGINGTLTGVPDSLDSFIARLRARREFADIRCRHSFAAQANPVFHRLKVRVKSEIVNFGDPAIDPAARAGERVGADRWNALLDDPEVVVVDTRNSYEVDIGGFPGALDPRTTSFREFPQFVREHLDPQAQPNVALFCTGGVRCEKASAFLLGEGFSSVYQLDGGILNYMETVSAQANRWQGECFVFDQRVSVDQNLTEGSYTQCFACRRPLSERELASAEYTEGVSCSHCIGKLSATREASLVERARQVALAVARGEQHIGAPR